MNVVFYLSAVVAVVSTVLVISRPNPIHALLYLIVSLLSIALLFYMLGALFVAALEVIIYAAAIMVLFAFVVMMLNLGRHTVEEERLWLPTSGWIGPALLAAILLAETIYIVTAGMPRRPGSAVVGPEQVGIALFGPYLIGTELASFILLAGLVTAYHLSRRDAPTGKERKP